MPFKMKKSAKRYLLTRILEQVSTYTETCMRYHMSVTVALLVGKFENYQVYLKNYEIFRKKRI